MCKNVITVKIEKIPYSIDATNMSDSLGRMVDDSPARYANARMKRVVVSPSNVHLCLFSLNQKEQRSGISKQYFFIK